MVESPSSLIDAFLFDDQGYFDGVTAWQVLNGEPLKCANSTELCPWANGQPDATVFYRFVDGQWMTEKKPTCAADFENVIVSHVSVTMHDEEMRRLIQLFSNEDGFHQERGDNLEWMLVKNPEPTPEEKAAKELETAKNERAQAVEKIVVDVDGMKFDGDEKSQQRMSIAISTMTDNETILWVLADDTAAEVTKEQLQRALRLAREEQTALWNVPYTSAKVLK